MLHQVSHLEGKVLVFYASGTDLSPRTKNRRESTLLNIVLLKPIFCDVLQKKKLIKEHIFILYGNKYVQA